MIETKKEKKALGNKTIQELTWTDVYTVFGLLLIGFMTGLIIGNVFPAQPNQTQQDNFELQLNNCMISNQVLENILTDYYKEQVSVQSVQEKTENDLNVFYKWDESVSNMCAKCTKQEGGWVWCVSPVNSEHCIGLMQPNYYVLIKDSPDLQMKDCVYIGGIAYGNGEYKYVCTKPKEVVIE